jgi:c-di-AMP phosphodiesterase-like protein
MKNRWNKWSEVPELNIYLLIILALSLILMLYDRQVGMIALAMTLLLVLYNWHSSRRRNMRWSEYIEGLSKDMNWAAKKAVLSVPLPMLTMEMDGTVIWYNKHMGQLFKGLRLMGENISFYVPELDVKKLAVDEQTHVCRVVWKDRHYDVMYYVTQRGDREDSNKTVLMLYWIDVTDYALLQQNYAAKQPVVGLVYVDNYDEVMASAEEVNRPAIAAEVDKVITEWIASLNSAWCKYERDKYMLVFEHSQLDELERRRFDILDSIREIAISNRLAPTLSIGIGIEGESYAEEMAMARNAIDLALGRGGDQAVIRDREKFYFYGGKNRTVEKTSKVKSRVIAHALRGLMEPASKILIMSHELADFDSIGAAIGIWRGAANVGKKAHIVLDRGNPSIGTLLEEIKQHEEYADMLISSEQALDIVSADALVIVVDIQRASYTECPELLESGAKIVVIDHHRRPPDSIENATLAYLEPYASSTCEMVTEILQYISDKIKVEPLVAKALLAGIMVDTKNFAFKTGVRTFEAASLLRRMGADPTAVRQLFQDDFNTFTARAKAVTQAKIEFPGIAISVCPDELDGSNIIAAQAADTLINIKGIHTSFVLMPVNDEVYISGRSMGDVNVQLILEKLGGGGHLTMAGAQLTGVDINKAKEMLVNAIKEYLKEDSSKK